MARFTRSSRMVRSALVAIIASALTFGCKISYYVKEPEKVYPVVRPLDSFWLTTDQSQIKQMVVHALGDTAGDYGFDETNNGLRGRFQFDPTAKAVVFDRSNASAGAYQDFNFFPADPSGVLKFRLRDVRSVSVKVRALYATDNTVAMCGLVFGYGAATGASQAPLSGVNLRMLNRDWSLATNNTKHARDYWRVFYQPSITNERIVIDSPISSYAQTNAYDLFTSSEWSQHNGDDIDLIPSTSDFYHASDWVTFRQTLTLDREAHKMTIKIEPLDSNVDRSDWKNSLERVWNMSEDPTLRDPLTNSARGGLDLANISGPTPLTWPDFYNQTFQFGFSANGWPQGCTFSDLNVTLEN